MLRPVGFGGWNRDGWRFPAFGLLRLPRLTADTFGELLMFYQVATGYAGVWYNVDPFDQPGVELGKRLTFAALGRPGFSGERLASPPAGDEA